MQIQGGCRPSVIMTKLKLGDVKLPLCRFDPGDSSDQLPLASGLTRKGCQ